MEARISAQMDTCQRTDASADGQVDVQIRDTRTEEGYTDGRVDGWLQEFAN